MKNISKIISNIFLIFSILFLCYVFYRSEILYSGAKFNYYLKYYVIALSSVILSVLSFFIKDKLKVNLATIFISTLIAFYLLEGYLIIQTKNDFDRVKTLTYKKETGKDVDRRTEYEFYIDLKKEDPNVVPVILPYHFLQYQAIKRGKENKHYGIVIDKNLNYLPLSGISNRKTFHGEENGYYDVYQSDRYGFKNPDEEWDNNEIEFIVLGDSMMHAGVNEPDTLAANLRKLNKNESSVLNLSMSGNGPLFQYATLREYLPAKKVKRILWMYYEGNDFGNMHMELQEEILTSYLKDKNFSQNLISEKQFVEKLLFQKIEEAILNKKNVYTGKRTNLIAFLLLTKVRKLTIEKNPDTPDTPTAYIKEFETTLNLANELAKENSSILYFVYLPDYMRYLSKENLKNPLIKKNHKELIEIIPNLGGLSKDNYKYFQNNKNKYRKSIQIAERLMIPIIDLDKELFKKHLDPLSLFPFGMHGHYNEKGHKLLAETIFAKINELEK